MYKSQFSDFKLLLVEESIGALYTSPCSWSSQLHLALEINVYFLPSYSPLKGIKCPTLWCEIISMWCWAWSFEIYVITVIHCHRMCSLTLLCISKVSHKNSCWFCHLMGYGFGHDLGSICESSHSGWQIKARHGAAACKHGRTCNFLFILPQLLVLQSLNLSLLV